MAVKREKVVRTAEKYVQRGKINAAIREYRKVLAEQPDDAATLNRVGDLYARSDQIEEAIGLFTQIAENYTADGFFPKATAIYKKIIKLDPTRLGVYEHLASLYHRQGLLNEARTQYQVLADYYVKHDNATSATAIYERMTEVDPEDPSLRVRLAELYQEQKLLDKAMAQYQDIAGLMIDHGHPDDAEQVLMKGLEVDPGDLEFIEVGVGKLRGAGADAAAARFLARAAEENPKAAAIAEREGAPIPEAAEPAAAEATAAAATAEVSEEAPVGGADAGAAAPAEALDALDLSGEDADLELEVDGDDVEAAAGGEVAAAEAPGDFEDGAEAAGRVPFEDHASSGEITLEMDALELELDTGELDTGELDTGELEADELDTGALGEGALEDGEIDPGREEGPVATAEPVDRGTDPVMQEPAPPPADGSIDTGFLERTAAELHPERIQQEEDLLTEAEVLVKYGLTGKATERLGELLELNPDHVGGQALLVRLHLEQGSYQGAAELATSLIQRSGGTDAGSDAGSDVWSHVWSHVWEALEAAGFVRRDDGVVVPPATEEAEAETVVDAAAAAPAAGTVGEAGAEVPGYAFSELDLELEEPFFDLEPAGEEAADEERTEDEPAGVEEAGLEEADPEAPTEEVPTEEAAAGAVTAAAEPAPAPRRSETKRPRSRTEIDEMLASLTAEALPKRRLKPATDAAAASPPQEAQEAQEAPDAAPPAAPEPTAPPAAEAPPQEERRSAEAIPPPPPPAAPSAPPPEAQQSAAPPEASPDWLENTVSGDGSEAALFSDEEEFFDLAAELEEELSQEGALAEDEDLLLETPKEQSLEEIVEGFKKGVSENLSQEDHQTHFDLGIAYREMGLLDEAIGEFQVAAKSPDLLVECCSMLGLSFLEKGLPELAVKWYRRGLDVPGLAEEKQLGLLYDLGNAYMLMGDRAEAHATFVDIYGTNSNYRDVVAKIEETRPR